MPWEPGLPAGIVAGMPHSTLAAALLAAAMLIITVAGPATATHAQTHAWVQTHA